MGRAWLSLRRFLWLLLLLSVWLLGRLLLVMLFVSRKFLILLLVRRRRSLIRILCLFLVSVIKLMLTRQNIIVNRNRLADYEQCRYICKNKQDFCDNISPERVVEFSLLCDSLGLEPVARRVDYYTPELVGRCSPYFFGAESDREGDFGLDEKDKYYFVSLVDFDCLSMYFEPFQLELPFK